MKLWYQILANSLIAGITNNFTWFALTYWAYLETQSVLATSFVGGSYLAAVAVSGFWLGSIVDHHKKKFAMLLSSFVSGAAYTLSLIVFTLAPPDALKSIESGYFWAVALFILTGVIAGNLRNIALPTLVTILVPEPNRDKANGLIGSMVGIGFSITSVASGLSLAYLGMNGVLLTAIGLNAAAFFHLLFLTIPEKDIVHSQEHPKKLDIKGTIAAINSVSGLFALIFFTTFNNFLGGVFMSLMDAYGLTLVSVQVWGFLWGVLSFGFILGGLFVAKFGLGKNPLRSLFAVNLVLWTISIFFTIQPSIFLLAGGMFIWLCLMPVAEAIEHTIIQKVVPLKRQGRVFGFAQSVEQAASPLTAFIIGPIAQFVFIPFMTTGAGVNLIGSWYGTGIGRGIALVFSLTGIIGLIATLIAMRSKSYQALSARYQEPS